MKVDPYMTAISLIGDNELTEELLHRVIEKLPSVIELMYPEYKISPQEIDEIKRRIEANIGVQMKTGMVLNSGEQEPWLDDRRASINWNYWEAYRKELQFGGFNNDVIRVLNEDTDNILNECGNPDVESSWRVQGLVMGDVQSGKTASYCGLINKAADSGYKVIVLLTGMIEDLRAQTQERIDSGFVGRDSRTFFESARSNIPIGVGRFRQILPNVLTSIDYDFLTTNKRALGGIPLENIKEPVILVMKKNSAPLRNLISFLDPGWDPEAPLVVRKQLDLPFLLIDDEADNASVNAKKDEDPATINKLIRYTLKRFSRASYVAYTATPFANVFINPAPELEDLFPRNFVYGLNTPTNYIGVSNIFGARGSQKYQLVQLTDAEEIFPDKHKKDHPVDKLPVSLFEAVETFLLSCAIRDIRGESLRHRSMLVNVTRFTAVQDSVAKLLKNELYTLTEDIKQYLASGEVWEKQARLKQLHNTWKKHYSSSDVSWDEVRRSLYESIASVKILTINQSADASDRLDYRSYRKSEKGRRVIAVGGLTLSRGLTLEGLCVSYFYRNSKAYDTLLQMGRWFGYRSGYDDLCRIWMDCNIQDWFTHIAGVVSELRSDFRRMHINKQPPSLFGIRVRSHPEALIVTALNKMRNAQEVEVAISYSETGVETPFIPRDKIANKKNLSALADFVEKLGSENKEMYRNRHYWKSISASRISAFLSEIEISNMNIQFATDIYGRERPILSFIENNDIEELRYWDICIPQGLGKNYEGLRIIGNNDVIEAIKPRQRQFENTKNNSYLKLNKQRVGEISDEKISLTAVDINSVEKDWLNEQKNDSKKKTIPGYMYRRYRKRPLLTIHLIEPVDPPLDSDKERERAKRMMLASDVGTGPFLAISISFPKFDDNDERKRVTYRLNKVALKTMGLIQDEYDDED